MVANDPHSPPRIIAGRYRLGSRLGSGLEAAVFEAFDEQLQRTVVLKLVHPDLSDVPHLQAEFRIKMAIAGALQHPHVAAVLDWGQARWNDRDVLYVVGERFTGGSLRDILDRGRLLSPSQVLVVGLDACKALDAIHRQGLVHTDVRPSTLVFGDDRRLRVVEVGLAQVLHDSAGDVTGRSMDRAKYSSPEEAQGKPLQPKSDVYSLCLALLEAVTGHVPFVGDSTVATLANRVDKLMPVSADLGPLAAVFERAGRPLADDRYSAAEFGRALVQAAEKMPRPAPLPILTNTLFAPERVTPGQPVDPTGPLVRPVVPPVAPAAVAVPVPVEPAPAEVAPVASETVDTAAVELIPDEPMEELPTEALPVAAPPVEDPRIDDPSEPVDEEAADDLPDGLPDDDLSDDGAPGDDLPGAANTDLDPTQAVPAVLAGAVVAPEADVVPAPLPPPAPPVVPPPPSTERSDALPTIVQATEHEAPATAVVPATSVTETITVATAQTDDDFDPADEFPEHPPVRSGGRRWVLALLVVMAVVGGVLAWYSAQPESIEVPDVSGLRQGEAINQLGSFEWTVAEEASETVDVGAVIRTEPGAGTMLEKGDAITIYVSTGPAPRPLPELVGLTVAEATTALSDLGLVLIEGAPVFDETVAPGVVLSWVVPASPTLTAGATVTKGTTVQVVASAGPAPRTVPDLAGATLADATATLEALGLLIVQGGPEEFNNTVPPGQIIRQSPAPGATVERGATITIVVSKGQDLVTLPNIIGQTFEPATAALAAAGLGVNSVTGDGTQPLQSVSVNGAPATAGQQFLRGTKVDLAFAPTPAPPTTPPVP